MRRRVPCEQQLNMGQSVLRGAEKSVAKCQMFVCNKKSNLSCSPKGNWVNIPKPRHGDRPLGVKSGNANELGDVGGSPGESCLFFVRFRVPESGLPGDRDAGTVKHHGSCGVQSALVGP
jgi:hypothetical protein